MLAGDVTAVLGARVDASGFTAYDAAIARSVAAAGRAEQASTAHERALVRSNRALAGFAKTAAVGVVGGVGLATAAIAKSVKVAANFEEQLSALKSVTGANGKVMADLKKQAMDAGAATKYSALEAAQAQTELAKGGMSVQKIMKGGLAGALALAAAGEMNLADAAATTANALNLFNLNGDQATHVADAMAQAANATTADVGDFARALTQGGAAARAAGLSFDQTMVILESLAEAGVKGSDAGTSMKAMLTQIANPSKKAQEAMRSLNLEFFDAQGKIKPLPAIAKELDQAFGGLTEKQRLQAAATIAGTDGMRALLSLYDQSPASLRKLAAGLAEQGTAAEVAAQKQDNLKGKWEGFTGALETAAIGLGGALLPHLTKGVEQMTDALNRGIENGGLERFTDGLISGGRTAVQVVGTLADAVQQVGSTIGPVVSGVADLANSLGLLSPTGITAMVAAFAGFKAVTVLGPQIAQIAMSIQKVRAASAGGSLLGAAISANPYVAAGVAVGGLAAALVALGGKESAAAAAAREHAAAMRDLKAAMDDVSGAERDEAEAKTDAKLATLSVGDAERELARVRKDKKSTAADIARAESNLTRARLDQSRANDRVARTEKNRAEKLKAARKEADETEAKAKKRLEEANAGSLANTAPGQYAETLKRRAAAEKAVAEAVKAKAVVLQQAGASEKNVQLLIERGKQILPQYADGWFKASAAIKKMGMSANRQAALLAGGAAKGAQADMAKVGQMLSSASTKASTKVEIRASIKGADSVRAQLLAIRAIARGVPPSVVSTVTARTKGKTEVLALRALIAGVPPEKVAKILADTHGKDRVDALRKAIGDVRNKKANVNASNTGKQPNFFVQLAAAMFSVRSKNESVSVAYSGPSSDFFSNLAGSISRVVGKTVNVVTNFLSKGSPSGGKKRATGRSAGQSELAQVGEGRDPREYVYSASQGLRFTTDGPMVMNLPADAWVIPLDRMQQGRAASLLVQLAAAEGVEALPGYAGARKGKSSKKKPPKKYDQAKDKIGAPQRQPLGLPNVKPVTPTILPLDQLNDELTRRQSVLDQAVRRRDDNARAAKEKGKNKKLTKAARAAKANQGYFNRVASNAKRERNNAQRLVQQAKSFQDEIDRLQTLADEQGTRMNIANKAGDRAGYSAAKAGRGSLLDKLHLLVGQARRKLKDGKSNAAASLDAQLATLESDLQENQSANMDVEQQAEQQAAERLADTGMTDQERAYLDQLERDVSLAALTEGLGDDQAAASAKVSFLESMLGQAMGPRPQSAAVVRDLADQVKSARDNLSSLTGGSSTNDNADLQAQIDQQKERTRVAEETARLNAQTLATWSGRGDIGTGAANAYQAGSAAPNITVNTLHPGDPATLRAIGDAATAGFGMQGGRISPRAVVG